MEKDKKDKKKAFLIALGLGAAGTAAYFFIKKGSESNSGGSVVQDTSNVGKTTLPSKKKKKLLPVKSTASPSVPVVYEPFVPKDIAEKIKSAGENKNLTLVLQLLKKIKSRADYMLVNKEYEHLRYWGNKSIVTDLLVDFFTSESDKAQIRKEILRMGLAYDSATDKWSIPQNLSGYKTVYTIKTITTTYVEDSTRTKRLIIKPNTILGIKIYSSNGMTFFKATDNKAYSVPTKDVIAIKQ